MTRLVGVRAVCDVCSAARAELFCVIHRHVSCAPCDETVHAHPADSAHQRVDLSCAVTALPFCEQCDKAPATSYCEIEGTTLCDHCDDTVHRTKTCAAHERRLISKALAQRTVSFTGMPPSAVVASPTDPQQPVITTPNAQNTLSPHSPRAKGRRRGVSSPMKRRSKRDNMSTSSSEERNLLDVAARTQAARNRHAPSGGTVNAASVQQNGFQQQLMPAVHPQQQRVRPMQFNEASPAPQNAVPHTQIQPSIPGDNQSQLAYMHAVAMMRQREQVDFFTGGMQAFFPPELMSGPAEQNVMLDDRNIAPPAASRSNSSMYPTNIAPHPGVMGSHPEASTVAAAAAAATAAGEMFLLSAASSDQPSGSSEGLTPPFSGLTPPPDAAGLAAAATAAAESTVAAIGGHSIPRPTAHAVRGRSELQAEAFMVQSPNVAFHPQQQQLRMAKPPRLRHNAPDVLDDAEGMVDVQRDNLFEQSDPMDDPSSSGHLTDVQGLRVDGEECRQSRTDPLSNHHDGVSFLGTTSQERDDYPLTDFDIPRDDFGAFDALDLSSFDNNGAPNFGILSQRSRGCPLDDVDQNS